MLQCGIRRSQGREVPGVVAVLLSLAKCGRLGVMMFRKGLWCMRPDATYAKTATSQKGTLLSDRLCICKCKCKEPNKYLSIEVVRESSYRGFCFRKLKLEL